MELAGYHVATLCPNVNPNNKQELVSDQSMTALITAKHNGVSNKTQDPAQDQLAILIDSEVQSLLQKQAIEIVCGLEHLAGFLS